jgi:hypothetical protein
MAVSVTGQFMALAMITLIIKGYLLAIHPSVKKVALIFCSENRASVFSIFCSTLCSSESQLFMSIVFYNTETWKQSSMSTEIALIFTIDVTLLKQEMSVHTSL